jgi:hypothetical protein
MARLYKIQQEGLLLRVVKSLQAALHPIVAAAAAAACLGCEQPLTAGPRGGEYAGGGYSIPRPLHLGTVHLLECSAYHLYWADQPGPCPSDRQLLIRAQSTLLLCDLHRLTLPLYL